MVSAKGVLRTEGFPYALDNGAWTAFQQSRPFDEEAFIKAYDLLGEGSDFVVLPDIVGGGMVSLEYSLNWLNRLAGDPVRFLLAVQDGMTSDHIRPILSPKVGIFLGGSTEWKLQTAIDWGSLAAERGCHYHIARVNTEQRIRLCAAAGADSFDGSGVSRFPSELKRLDFWRRIPDLFSPRLLGPS